MTATRARQLTDAHWNDGTGYEALRRRPERDAPGSLWHNCPRMRVRCTSACGRHAEPAHGVSVNQTPWHGRLREQMRCWRESRVVDELQARAGPGRSRDSLEGRRPRTLPPGRWRRRREGVARARFVGSDDALATDGPRLAEFSRRSVPFEQPRNPRHGRRSMRGRRPRAGGTVKYSSNS